MAKLEVSDIARSIKGRIREVEGQLKDHKALSDSFERLKGTLGRLEGGVRARINAKRRGQPPVTLRGAGHSGKGHRAGAQHPARAPRGENKEPRSSQR